MAVNVPSVGSFENSLLAAIVNLRNAYQNAVNLNNWVTAMGGSTFLQAAAPNGMGMVAADANAVVAALSNCGNCAAMATALQNSQTMWGGQ